MFIGRTDVEAETPILWPPDSPSAGDLRELPGVPLRGEGSCGGGGAPRAERGECRLPGGQSIGVSASTSVLPMNIQG